MANDPTDDPVLNCLLEVCCLSGSTKQSQAMADHLVKNCQCDPAVAKTVGDHILATFDLAEKGTLKAFKASVARLARGASL